MPDFAISRRGLLLGGGVLLAGSQVGRVERFFAADQPAAAAPATGLPARAAAQYRALLANFWDEQAGHVAPTNGGNVLRKFGLIDRSADTPFPSFWQMESLENLIFHQLDADPGARARIARQWAHVQSVRRSDTGALAFPPEVLAGKAALGATVNTSDDGVWHGLYLMHVHQVTGDARALAYLADLIPNACALFPDPNGRSNPQIDLGPAPNVTNLDYGLGSAIGADGVRRFRAPAFAYGRYGMLYAPRGSVGERQYGYVSTSFDAGWGILALYVAERLGVPAYRRMAELAWAWIREKLRTPAPADASRKAEGIYETELVLDPEGDIGVGPSNQADIRGRIDGTTLTVEALLESGRNRSIVTGFQLSGAGVATGTRIVSQLSGEPGKAGTYRLDRAQRVAERRLHVVQPHLTPRNDFFGKPVRALDSTFLGGAVMMAVLGARLFRATGQDKYRVEAVSIARAIIDPQAYGRDVGGRRLIANTRDPFSEGHFFVPFAREVLSLPGAPAACRRAIIDTAEHILATCVDPQGYVGADWAGPELNPVTGRRTWAEDYAASPGGQASPRQIMTSCESMCVVQAGAWLAANG